MPIREQLVRPINYGDMKEDEAAKHTPVERKKGG
jgi:hypothetical protein